MKYSKNQNVMVFYPGDHEACFSGKVIDVITVNKKIVYKIKCDEGGIKQLSTLDDKRFYCGGEVMVISYLKVYTYIALFITTILAMIFL